MSRKIGEKIVKQFEILPNIPNNIPAYIRWTKGKEIESVFTILIPFDVTIGRGMSISDIEFLPTNNKSDYFQIRIFEGDLYRMVNADHYDLTSDEQQNLDDVIFHTVSLTQYFWYLSKSVLNETKRASKRCGYPQWITLVKREAKGGQRKGIKKIRKETIFSKEEIERIETLIENYDRIVKNCLKYDWVQEFCELEKDIAKYKGLKITKKESIEKFTKLRKKYLN